MPPLGLNGYWWVEQPEGYRQGIALGSVMALNNASLNISLICQGREMDYIFRANEAHIIRELKRPPNADGSSVFRDFSPNVDESSVAARTCREQPEAKILNFNRTTFDKLMDGLNEFYNDSRNKNIPVIYAMYYVRDEIQGKSAKELEVDLLNLRH
jgi:hypothetical protein